MFAAMLRAQWIWSRGMMLFFLGAGFTIPLLSVPLIARFTPESTTGSLIVGIGETLGLVIAITVSIAAVALALQNWSSDDRGGHIYALSLPIDRRRYLAYRFGGGVILLALLALTILLGAVAATALLELPSTLRTYPVALALRALLAAWLVHSFAFLLRFGAGSRAKHALLALLTVGALALVLPIADQRANFSWISIVARLLVGSSGPFGILFGHWSLIDV